MRVFLLAGLLTATAAAAPLTREKIELVPGLYPNERRELARRVAPLFGKSEGVREALVAAGVDERVAERIDRVSPGPLLVERYAHGLPLEAPDLSPAQRELLEHLHPSVLAAQWALWIQRERVQGTFKDDELRRRQLVESFDRQIREIEKRYWRIVGYALTEEQRVAIHPLLPQPYQRPPNLQAHVYQVPGLTLGQAGRLRALIAEFESESATDSAEIRRLQVKLREQGLAEEERREAAAALDEATDRLGELMRGVVERAHGILTPEQIRYIDALPPLVGPEDRTRNPGEIVAEMGLTPEQEEKLQPLAEKLRARIEAVRREAEANTRELREEMSGESPQMMTMQMMQQGAAGEAARAMEEVARTALLDVLEKRQVLGWVISPR